LAISQTNSIAGLWSSPRGLAVMKFKFDSTGRMQYNFYGCMSSYQRKGKYEIRKDSVIIKYDSLTKEEKLIYQIKADTPSGDTLYIINHHKIQVNELVFISDIEQKEEVKVYMKELTKREIVGRYEGNEIYCRMRIRIKRNHTIKIYRKCESNEGYTVREKWRIEGNSLIVGDGFEDKKWEIKNNCIYKSISDKIVPFACKE
jgi:hypothetical protein